MASRENFVYIAKLAEQAERYDGKKSLVLLASRSLELLLGLGFVLILLAFSLSEMVDAMKNVAKLDVELTVEERNLLSVGYKNVIGARRASWRILSSIEQKEEAKGNESHVKKIREYRQKVEAELSNICMDIMTVIDEHLIPSASAGESSVFYYKMWVRSEIWLRLIGRLNLVELFGFVLCFLWFRKGDYYRYLAEFKTGNDKKEAAEQSLKAYQVWYWC